MSEPKLTDWFHNTKPTLKGVYERAVFSDGTRCYARWSGKHWIAFAPTIQLAHNSSIKSAYQVQAWRGLASDPASKP